MTKRWRTIRKRCVLIPCLWRLCNIASLLLETGRTKDAAAHYVAALQTKADHLPAIVSLAWIYATASSEAGSQHATEAVRLAEQACRISGCKQSGVLDTLAAAYANAGRFQDAIKIGKEAFSIAKAAGEDDFADSIRARIALYENGSPFRGDKLIAPQKMDNQRMR
jgi:tetratricopeptide (TPR) repeat protein